MNEDPDETISARPAFAPPKDRLLADVLCEYPTAIVEYMQHDTLFQHIEEEKLNDKVGKRIFIYRNSENFGNGISTKHWLKEMRESKK